MSSNKNIVLASFFALSILGLYLMYKAINGVMGIAEITDPLDGIIPITVAEILAILGGIGLFFWLYTKKSYNDFAEDVVKEIKKVTWPTKDETRSATIVVFVMTAILTVILGTFDWIFASLTRLIYS